MKQHGGFFVLIAALLGLLAARAASADRQDDPLARLKIERTVHGFERSLGAMRGGHSAADRPDPALVADVEIFIKAARWGLRYDSEGRPTDTAIIERALSRCIERFPELGREQPNWAKKRGRLVRGYVSSVDGSVQPYGLVMPVGYDSKTAMRLDVVLHGSTRPQGNSELKFVERFDDGDEDSKQLVEQPFIELHPLGRVENCYRWSGETDVFEAIDDVCRKYNIDRNRIVLRGMSMGASGTWHLGLKRPDRFAALGPYCGYVDTHRFSETPLETFVKVGSLPDHQELALHILDSIDYAANAGVVPVVAAMGENDIFFQSHVLMGEAMQREGLALMNLISPGTGHVIDPATHAEQMKRIEEYAARGIAHAPRQLRYVTWTLKYNRCHWIELLRLDEHYRRSEISARILDDGMIEVDQPRNVAKFAISPAVLPEGEIKVRIAGTEIAIGKEREEGKPRQELILERHADRWVVERERGAEDGRAKRMGLTGPIDDAFTTKFLCVRGTGRPWNERAGAYCQASLLRFAYEWNRYFRGELPVKEEEDVTAEDVRSCNLILFGDPGSNSLMVKVLAELPIRWTREELVVAGESYRSAEHVPALIYPNPLAAAAGRERYVVINSGHTFREAELARLNYLLFPRWGDWAVLKVSEKAILKPSDALDETVLRAGFFDEAWQFKP